MNLTKRTPYRNKKYLEGAKGEECTFRGPTCNGDPATVVPCHSNLGEDGKGMGQKADDDCIFYGCSDCHDFYDGGWVKPGSYSQWETRNVAEQVQAMADRAIIRTMRRRREQGL